MRKLERSLIRNPDFSQPLRLPLFTKGLRFYLNLQNNFVRGQGSLPASRDTLPASHENFPASRKNFPASRKNFPASRKNFPASRKNFPASHENFPASRVRLTTLFIIFYTLGTQCRPRVGYVWVPVWVLLRGPVCNCLKISVRV